MVADIGIRLQILFPNIIIGVEGERGVDCQITEGGITWWGRPEPPPTDQEFGAVSQVEIDGSKASVRYAELEKLVISTANEKVNTLINQTEKAHWMGVADALARKQSLWIGDQIGGNPDPATYPPLTDEEHQTWFSLSLIQLNTSNVRGAAMAIIASLHAMTIEEINALPDDWVINHQLWP